MIELQDLTLAVTPLWLPVTTSLNIKLPLEVSEGLSIVIVGVSVYPSPALVILIAVIDPAAETTAVAAAETVEIPVNVIVGEFT